MLYLLLDHHTKGAAASLAASILSKPAPTGHPHHGWSTVHASPNH